jgi:hypothetical protein
MHLMEQHPNFDLSLGFDALHLWCEILNIRSGSDVRACRRVKYCSDAVDKQDVAVAPPATIQKKAKKILGHTSIICALLQLCDDDFDTEDGKASQR